MRPGAILAVLVFATTTTAACKVRLDTSPAAAAAVRAQDHGDLPYHPLVYQLDLSILAYQLYAQTLVWPWDPYSEELAGGGRRQTFLDVVRSHLAPVADAQRDAAPRLDAYRGPGVLTGFPDNPTHDPILYQYSRLHPWSHQITNATGKWTEYRTPRAITGRVRDVFVCRRAAHAPEGTVAMDALVPGRDDADADASDTLLAFEGGTGDKGEPGQPPSHSLLGFALLRQGREGAWDVHIAFRGSRSGSAQRAAFQAFSTKDPRGNPDWITDLGYREVDAPFITTVGQVSRGMSRTVETLVPQLFHCLAEAAGHRDPPRHITLTGHSLGGGLAQLFASGLLQGDRFGPDDDGMPEALRDWPWRALKLVTFGAPRVGDRAFAEALTAQHLDQDFFHGSATYDVDAIGVAHPSIVPRLADPTRPAGFRVLIPTDPITTSLFVGGKHVGQSVYTNLPRETAPHDGDDHEPIHIRRFLTDILRAPDRIPDEAWRYLPLEAWAAERDPARAGDPAEFDKLIDGIRAYHAEHDVWHDAGAFDRSAVWFQALLATP